MSSLRGSPSTGWAHPVAELIPGERRSGLPFEVEVLVLADIHADAEDPPAPERKARRIRAAHRVGAVVADAESITAQRERPDLGLHRALGDDLLADIEFRGPERFAVFTGALSDEFHTESEASRLQLGRDQGLLGLDAQEVIDVVQSVVLDEQGVAAEP